MINQFDDNQNSRLLEILEGHYTRGAGEEGHTVEFDLQTIPPQVRKALVNFVHECKNERMKEMEMKQKEIELRQKEEKRKEKRRLADSKRREMKKAEKIAQKIAQE